MDECLTESLLNFPIYNTNPSTLSDDIKQVYDEYVIHDRVPILIWKACDADMCKRNRLQTIISSMLHNNARLVIRVKDNGQLIFRSIKTMIVKNSAEKLSVYMETQINMVNYFLLSSEISGSHDFILCTAASSLNFNKNNTTCYLVVYYENSSLGNGKTVYVQIENKVNIKKAKYTDADVEITTYRQPTTFTPKILHIGDDITTRIYGKTADIYYPENSLDIDGTDCFSIVISMNIHLWCSLITQLRSLFSQSKNHGDCIKMIFERPTKSIRTSLYIVENSIDDASHINTASSKINMLSAKTREDVETTASSLYVAPNAEYGKMVTSTDKRGIHVKMTREILSMLTLPFVPNGDKDTSRYMLLFSHKYRRVILLLRDEFNAYREYTQHCKYFIFDEILECQASLPYLQLNKSSSPIL